MNEMCLTGDLPQAADEQRLVILWSKWNAVTQSVLMAVFELMFCIYIRHTQQVLLQQLRAAQHRTVVDEGSHKPDQGQQSGETHIYLSFSFENHFHNNKNQTTKANRTTCKLFRTSHFFYVCSPSQLSNISIHKSHILI